MQQKFRLRFFSWFFLLNLILNHFQLIFAQYKSFRDTSTVMPINPSFKLFNCCPSLNRLTDRTYKARNMIFDLSNSGPYGDYSKWFTIDQGSPKTVVLAFIVNDSAAYARFGGSYICIGNNAADPKAAGNLCTSVFYDGGFIQINLPAGRYVFIYREGKGGYPSDFIYALAEIGLYRMPNLVGSATIITSYNPISPTYGSINLKSNLGNRYHSRDGP